MSRVLALHAPPKAKQSLDLLWAAATDMVKGSDRPGDINQALIELGATVCKPRDPQCSSCPLKAWCRAYGHQDSCTEVSRPVCVAGGCVGVISLVHVFVLYRSQTSPGISRTLISMILKIFVRYVSRSLTLAW